MKSFAFLILVLVFVTPSYADEEYFLGAPVISQGKEIQRTETRLEVKTKLSHDEVLEFYKRALRGYKDIKYRDWKDATYIEDDGNRKWHSITIQKNGEQGTTVLIVKDSWTWIFGTLILRFIGVFAVLIVLFGALALSGKIISKSIARIENKKPTN
jgi:hypothetical protein